ncbi:26S proteasome regulatory subunit 4A [Abeliophyllum distichum]|uniref:26S proteasome regulatory subunit 4A n=1 Tax=Abeliophyllum distichum TaxID=126358 RepID=A0ABD1T1B2_9LAMI
MPPPRLTIHTSYRTASTIANSTTVIYSLQSHIHISENPNQRISDYSGRTNRDLHIQIWILNRTIMVQGTPDNLNRKLPGDQKNDGEKKEKNFEPVAPLARVSRKQRKQKGPEA